MVSKNVYHFVDSNHGFELSLKKEGLIEKQGGGEGEFWKLFWLEAGKLPILGKEGFAWGIRGRRELYRLTMK